MGMGTISRLKMAATAGARQLCRAKWTWWVLSVTARQPQHSNHTLALCTAGRAQHSLSHCICPHRATNNISGRPNRSVVCLSPP